MSTEGARALLTVALFFVILPGFMLFVLKPGTAEFVITGFTLMIGVVFTTLAVIVIRFSSRSR